MLSQAAFNAFLKTLEEPPAHAIFILATTEKHKIIPTILSRCQIYDFSRIEASDIIAHLQGIATKEGIKAEHEALRIIAQKSDGCMRDALSLFDQMVSFTQGELTYSKVISSLNVLDYDYYFRLTDFVLEGKASQALLLFNEILVNGFEGNVFVEGLASHFRDLLVNGDPATAPLFEGSNELRNRYIEQAGRCKPKFIFSAIKLCNNCSMNYRSSRNKRLLVELTIIELTQLGEEGSDDSGGRGPKILKPLFNKVGGNNSIAEPHTTATQATSEPSRPAATPSTPKADSAVPVRAENNPAPRTSTVKSALEGRPAEMRIKRTGLFGGSRAFSESTVVEPEAPVPTTEKPTVASSTVTPAQEVKKPQAITAEEFTQAWTSFALRLPDNERALADRMKIMTPAPAGETTFSISVDNQLAAELFEKEALRICTGMKEYLNGTQPKMRVIINKIVVERHISDKTKQYEILKEKNPLIEKLRKELNLELAR